MKNRPPNKLTRFSTPNREAVEHKLRGVERMMVAMLERQGDVGMKRVQDVGQLIAELRIILQWDCEDR